MRVRISLSALYALLFPIASLASPPTITHLQTITPTNFPSGLSAITYAGNHTYYAADDSYGHVYRITLPIDPASGLAQTNLLTISPPIPLQGSDFEGIAFDPAHNSLLLADEAPPAIREFDLSSLTLLTSLPLPENLLHTPPNKRLESLSLHPSLLHLWTANEAPPIHLTQFSRPSTSQPWSLANQFPYTPDPIAGKPFRGLQRSGVADLCSLPNHSLLVLEREFSLKLKFPSFRIRIYYTSPPNPTKTLLYEISGPLSLANYEGICLGPPLPNNATSLLLIADGDNAIPALQILSLTFPE